MAQPQRRRRISSRALLIGAALALLVILVTPNAIATQIGGLIAWLWVSVMGAVTAIVAGLFGMGS